VLAWFETLSAIAHQTDKSEEGREIAYNWSDKSGKHGDERFENTWNRLEKLRKADP